MTLERLPIPPAARELIAALAAAAAALAVDTSILYVLTSRLHLYYVLSASIAFVVGTLVAWGLSVRFVFRYRRCASVPRELALFALIGVIGLFINDVVIVAVVKYLGLNYLIGKGCAAMVTFGFNYGLRRWLLFSEQRRGLAPSLQATPGHPPRADNARLSGDPLTP